MRTSPAVTKSESPVTRGTASGATHSHSPCNCIKLVSWLARKKECALSWRRSCRARPSRSPVQAARRLPIQCSSRCRCRDANPFAREAREVHLEAAPIGEGGRIIEDFLVVALGDRCIRRWSAWGSRVNAAPRRVRQPEDASGQKRVEEGETAQRREELQ